MTERGERATGVRDGWAGRARPAGQAQAAADASPPPRNTPTHHARRTATAATGGRRVAGGGRQHQRGGQAAAQPRPGGRGACAAGGRARPPVGDHAGRAANGVAPRGRVRLVTWRPARGKAGTDTRPRARDGCAPGPRRVLRPSHGWRRPPPPRPRRPAAHGLAASTCCIRGVARSHGRGRGAVGDAYTPPGGRRPRRGWRRRVGRGVRV